MRGPGGNLEGVAPHLPTAFSRSGGVTRGGASGPSPGQTFAIKKTLPEQQGDYDYRKKPGSSLGCAGRRVGIEGGAHLRGAPPVEEGRLDSRRVDGALPASGGGPHHTYTRKRRGRSAPAGSARAGTSKLRAPPGALAPVAFRRNCGIEAMQPEEDTEMAYGYGNSYGRAAPSYGRPARARPRARRAPMSRPGYGRSSWSEGYDDNGYQDRGRSYAPRGPGRYSPAPRRQYGGPSRRVSIGGRRW